MRERDGAMLFRIVMIAAEAGDAIADVYNSDFTSEEKADGSPITRADKRASEIISSGLSAWCPDVPVLSEEGADIPYAVRKTWRRFWMVDPLDGTKEFVKRNGQFTVNIALIDCGKPVLGVIYAPSLDLFYFAQEGAGSYRMKGRKALAGLKSVDDLRSRAEKMPLPRADRPFTVVASRSHLSKETQDCIDEIRRTHADLALVNVGSSLKFCMVAEGVAEFYPRFGPTMEWDIAAGQVIAQEAGATVAGGDGMPLRYNKEDLHNPWFIVKAEYERAYEVKK